MKNKKLFQALLPKYENLKEPLTQKDEGITVLLELASGWRRERCPRRVPRQNPYIASKRACKSGTITRKLIFYEEISPVKEPSSMFKTKNDIITKLIFGKDYKKLWKTTLDLWLCKCATCNASPWLETTITKHWGTKPGEPLSSKEIGLTVR
jgi:hypothetical protein